MNKKLHIRICTLFFVLTSAAMTSQAATITVINNANSGAGSLRQAITSANPGDTIGFAANVRGAILLTSELVINKNLIISGPGANLLGVEGQDQPTESRVFNLTTGTATISGLRISRGFSSGAGGGVSVGGGSLTLNSCLLNGNGAESAGGVIVSTGGFLAINFSTITGNSSAVEGGGVSNRGGTLVMTNSTIIGNQAPQGGGIAVQGGTTTILNCTVTGNGVSNPNAGDIGGLAILSPSTINLKNTIVARNIGSPTAPIDVGGAVNSQGNNLIGSTAGGSGFVASDLQNMNPLLDALANNGGTTYTVALLAGSPAINAGNNTGAPATDQRGVARPQGAAVDIGAYEFGVDPPAFGKIVYESTQDGNREIYTMNADFTNQTRLTNNTADDSAPKWSSDGTKIVFQSRRDGDDEIFSMNADGSVQTQLTFNSSQDTVPDWSPDGSRIVFVKGFSLPSEISVMDANGANQVQITGISLVGETQPSWSPDGSRIAFSAHPNSGQSPEIYVMNANGTNQNRLTFTTNTDTYPVWSPDGSTIAYTGTDNGTPHTRLMNLFNLSTLPVFNPNNPTAHAPAWAPDGTKLAHYNASGNIYIIDAIGEFPRAAALSPEGITIAAQLDWSGLNTPTGANVTAVSGSTSITFSSIATGGTTTAVPINPADAGTLPGGYSLGAGFPAYEITTTATFTAPITVCLQVPAVTNPMTFAALRILHNEGGTLIDRTILPPDSPAPNFATKTICARVSSLSPFVVATNNAPTAAMVSISGRVKVANKRGVHLARVSIRDSNGETRTTLTDFYGFYQFDDVPNGETYIISVAHRRYQFINNPRILTITEEIAELDFTAEPKF